MEETWPGSAVADSAAVVGGFPPARTPGAADSAETAAAAGPEAAVSESQSHSEAAVTRDIVRCISL